MTCFNVTYEIITQESAEDGEADKGFVAENIGLRDALEAVSWPGGIAIASCYPRNGARWFTVYGDAESFYVTGEIENRSLHFPESLTDSTRERIMRLAGVY